MTITTTKVLKGRLTIEKMLEKLSLTSEVISKCPSMSISESKPPPLPSPSSNTGESESKEGKKGGGKDDAFRCFRQLCAKIADENTYLGKTQLVSDMLTKGSSGGEYWG